MTNKRILWVEDNAYLLEIYVDGLKKSGYYIDYALNESEALDMINHFDFDLIIVDLILPSNRTGVSDLDYFVGLRLVSYLLKERKIMTPIVVLSVVNDRHIMEELFSMGIKAFFIKTKTLPREFKNQIDQILGNS